METALDALDDRVTGVDARAGTAVDDAERRAAVRIARRINYDVMWLHEAAPWVESARRSTLALGLVYFVDEMVAGLFKAPADVVMAPSAKYMYSTLYDLRKWLEGALHVPFPDGPTAMVVAYPVHEPDSLFLHLIIAHELGHSVVPTRGLTQQVHARDRDPGTTKNFLTAAAEQHVSAHGETPAASRVTVAAILKDWLTELLCDGLALAFLGPSFLFTFAAFSTPFEQDASNSHPPFALRMRLLLDQLEAAGLTEPTSRIAPATFSWIEETASGTRDGQPYFEQLEGAVRHLAPSILEVAAAHIGDDAFALWTDELDELGLLLRHDVLPAQLPGGAAAGRRSIVLAGWRRAFERYPDEPASLAAIVADRDHQRFLTKALEMSIVLERWRTL